MAPLKPLNPPVKLYEEYCTSKETSLIFPQTMVRVNMSMDYNFFDSNDNVVFKTAGAITSGTQKSFSDRDGNHLFDISELPSAMGGVKYKAVTPTGEDLCTIETYSDMKMRMGVAFTNRTTSQPMLLMLKTSNVPFRRKLYVYNGQDVVAIFSQTKGGMSNKARSLMIDIAPNLDCTIMAILGAVVNAKLFNAGAQQMVRNGTAAVVV